MPEPPDTVRSLPVPPPDRPPPQAANRVAGRSAAGEAAGGDEIRAPLEWPALAALIAFCTLWRLPGLADPPWINDEGVYAAVGRAILQGETLYRQIWENKPPAIYLLYALAQGIGGTGQMVAEVRMASLLAAVFTQIAVYGLVRTRYDPLTALLAVAVAGLLLDLPLLDGLEANAESFLIVGTSIAMALLWQSLSEADQRRVWPRCVPAGIGLGLALLCKLVAGTDLVAAVLLLLLWPRLGASRRLKALGALALGVALPVLAAAGWLAQRGLIGDALYAMIGYNRAYVSTGQTLHAPLVSAASLGGPLLLLVLAAVLYRHGRRTTHHLSMGAFAAAWLALALIGALASGRAYPHYFLQVVPALGLSAALFVHWTAGRAACAASSARLRIVRCESLVRRLLAALLVFWTVAVPLVSWAAVAREPAHAPPGSDIIGYYGHFWQYLTGDLSRTAYGNAMDPRVERNISVASYLADHPATPKRLYVWGNAPWIYFLSGYEHAARFLSAYYDPPIPGGMAQTLRELLRAPPPYIVVIEPETPPNAGIAALLARRYRQLWRDENAVIFALQPAAPPGHVQR